MFLGTIGGAAGADQSLSYTTISPHLLLFRTDSGNVLASVGKDGVLLLGIPSVTSTPLISSVLAKLTKSSMRYVVIFPSDQSHSQGDAGWGQRGAFVGMQENALERLGGHSMGTVLPLPPSLAALGVARPLIAFSEVLTFDLNGDGIHIVRQTPAYSSGDALAHFHVANLVYFGETFPGDGYPDLGPSQGGSLDGFVKTLGAWTNGHFRIVPARGKPVDSIELKTFCTMITTVRQRVQHQIDLGQTEREVVASAPTRDFDNKWGSGRTSPASFVRQVYASLKHKNEPQ